MSLEAIQRSILEIQKYYYHLVLLTGSNRAERTQYLKLLSQKAGYPYINISFELSERLLQYSSRERQYQSFQQVRELEQEAPTILVDKIEILFTPELKLNPVELLQDISKYRTLVVAWPGTYRDGMLIYAEPDHREYRKMNAPEAIILEL